MHSTRPQVSADADPVDLGEVRLDTAPPRFARPTGSLRSPPPAAGSPGSLNLLEIVDDMDLLSIHAYTDVPPSHGQHAIRRSASTSKQQLEVTPSLRPPLSAADQGGTPPVCLAGERAREEGRGPAAGHYGSIRSMRPSRSRTLLGASRASSGALLHGFDREPQRRPCFQGLPRSPLMPN